MPPPEPELTQTTPIPQPEPGELPHAYLARLLPGVAVPAGPRHLALWAWFGQLTRGVKPAARIEIWGRGGAKSSTSEQGTAYAGLTGRRRFALYVSGTQVQADAHLQAVAGLLERAGLARAVNAYGFSKGWTGQLLRASNGFNAISVGLDGNVRGAKLDELRPDLIILDDVDDRHDTPETTQKRLATILESILPAGSSDAAVLFVQNKIHADSCIAQLADGRAKALLDSTVTEEPAVWGLVTEERTGDDGKPRYVIVAGTPTWPEGQSLETCQAQINEWGLSAFLREAQHSVTSVAGGVYSHLTWRRCRADEVPDLVRTVVWCDPAVTKTDSSDRNGIHADGIAGDGTIYRLWSWEQRATPLETLLRALGKACELGAEAVGVETDQGGDTWESVYREAWRTLTDPHLEAPPADVQTLVAVLRPGVLWALLQKAGLVRNGDRELWDSVSSEVWALLSQPEPPEDMPDEVAALVAGLREALHGSRPPTFRSAKAGEGHGSKVARAQRQVAAYERGTFVHVIGTHEVLEAALTRFPHKPLDLGDASYWSWTDLTAGAKVHDLLSHYRRAAEAAAAPKETP